MCREYSQCAHRTCLTPFWQAFVPHIRMPYCLGSIGLCGCCLHVVKALLPVLGPFRMA